MSGLRKIEQLVHEDELLNLVKVTNRIFLDKLLNLVEYGKPQIISVTCVRMCVCTSVCVCVCMHVSVIWGSKAMHCVFNSVCTVSYKCVGVCIGVMRAS